MLKQHGKNYLCCTSGSVLPFNWSSVAHLDSERVTADKLFGYKQIAHNPTNKMSSVDLHVL